MSESDADDIERRRPEEVSDENDSGPVLSFDFDETPIPHWSEPGSGELPDGGERPDPPEVDARSERGSRLFPQLPDDPHLVDTSDTGLLDVLRSDTIPTIVPAEGVELFDTGPINVEDAGPNVLALKESVSELNDDEYSQTELSTDDLFHEPLFEDDDPFDASAFENAPIIGRIEEDETPHFDTGTVDKGVGEARGESEAASTRDDLLEADPSSTSAHDGQEDDSPSSDNDFFADEPTAELLLEDESSDDETSESDSLTELVSFDHTVRTGEEETPPDDSRQQPRVIELFDTPPSQRAMARTPFVDGEANADKEDNPDNLEEEGDELTHFGGPAPHWREGRRD